MEKCIFYTFIKELSRLSTDIVLSSMTTRTDHRHTWGSVAIKENWNALDLTLKYVRFGPQCAKLLKYSYFQLKLDQNSLKSGAKSGGAKDFVRQITNKRASSDVKSARMAILIFGRYLTWQLTRIKTNDG